MPGRMRTISNAGMNGFVSLLSPHTMPSASPASTASAPK